MIDKEDTRFIRDYRLDGKVILTLIKENSEHVIRVIEFDERLHVIKYYRKGDIYFPGDYVGIWNKGEYCIR